MRFNQTDTKQGIRKFQGYVQHLTLFVFKLIGMSNRSCIELREPKENLN